jgi:hypothetical protein
MQGDKQRLHAEDQDVRRSRFQGDLCLPGFPTAQQGEDDAIPWPFASVHRRSPGDGNPVHSHDDVAHLQAGPGSRPGWVYLLHFATHR